MLHAPESSASLNTLCLSGTAPSHNSTCLPGTQCATFPLQNFSAHYWLLLDGSFQTSINVNPCPGQSGFSQSEVPQLNAALCSPTHRPTCLTFPKPTSDSSGLKAFPILDHPLGQPWPLCFVCDIGNMQSSSLQISILNCLHLKLSKKKSLNVTKLFQKMVFLFWFLFLFFNWSINTHICLECYMTLAMCALRNVEVQVQAWLFPPAFTDSLWWEHSNAAGAVLQ